MARVVAWLYLASLLLLPWTWVPRFPWLHEHAQWSDVVFAATAVLWAVERLAAGARPRLRLVHLAMALYLGAAAVTVTRASLPKLVGMAELCALAVVTADLACRPGMMPAIGRVLSWSALLICASALIGLTLFYAGVPTRLVGTYGHELLPGRYARVEAGFYHPNLLASFCIFASAVIARDDAAVPRGLLRTAQRALALTCVLTISRGLLPFGVAALVRTGRRLPATVAAVACAALLLLGNVRTIAIDPTHPASAQLREANRRETIASSLRTAAAHPLSGSGLGTHPGLLRGVPHDAHLTPLNIAATLGLPALVGFLAIPFLAWRNRRRPTDLATWSGLFGVGLDALAQDVEDFRHVWILYGLAGADQGARRSVTAAGASGESSRSSPSSHLSRSEV